MTKLQNYLIEFAQSLHELWGTNLRGQNQPPTICTSLEAGALPN